MKQVLATLLIILSLAAFFAAPNSQAAFGKDMYSTMCAMCHGAAGKGDGPAANVFNPKPTDLTSSAVQGNDNATLERIISGGKKAMPAFKNLPQSDLKELVRYLRSLKK